MSIYGNPVMMGGGSSDIIPKTITQNGVYNASSDNADGYNPVTVNVPSGGIPYGTTPPDPSTGSDGDLYVQNFPVASNVNFVEYLESSGTQYIDTEVIGTDHLDIYAKLRWTANSYAMGVRTGQASSMTNAVYIGVGGTSGRPTMGGIKCTSSTGFDDVSFSCNTVDAFEISTQSKRIGSGYNALCINNGKYYVKNNQPTFTTNNMILFGVNQGGSIFNGICALYRVVIYEDGAPIHDYLPCLDGNGVACMWDNVAGQYVYNDGTGNFTYGSAVTPDELEPVLYQKVNGAWEVVA